jgi:hypothetical protein
MVVEDLFNDVGHSSFKSLESLMNEANVTALSWNQAPLHWRFVSQTIAAPAIGFRFRTFQPQSPRVFSFPRRGAPTLLRVSPCGRPGSAP